MISAICLASLTNLKTIALILILIFIAIFFENSCLHIISTSQKHQLLKSANFISQFIKTFLISRYYRSGLEMVRMANVYLAEGSLENAYILYMKFMTLFLEKIRKHPEYSQVPAQVKAVNQAKLKEVMPKAETLKKKLIENYTKEHLAYIEEQV